MRDYFIRRLLLVPVTLLGITMLVFTMTRLTPGGPLENAMLQAMSGAKGEAGKLGKESRGGLSPDQLLRLEEEYDFDKSIPRAYLNWLGVAGKETKRTRGKFDKDETSIEIQLPGSTEKVLVTRDGPRVSALKPVGTANITGWQARIESPESQKIRYARRMGMSEDKVEEEFFWQAVIYQPRFEGLFQGYLGRSTNFGDPVSTLIAQRVPISLFYGVLTFIITYGVCVPLGVLKAIRHRTLLDSVTSVLVFLGYSIPSFVLGIFLLTFFAARWGWFPIAGFVSAEFDTLSLPGKIADLFQHAALPLVCYLVGAFAFLTMLVKNNLLDNLAADHVRTAMATGATHREAVFKHALRNSLIPVAATFGGVLTIFVGGNFLIEKVFDIDGMGLLVFNGLLTRDYPVVMGQVTVLALLLLIGNIVSDFLVALADPRVSYR